MKRKICIVTGTRADYGLLYWVIKAVKQDPELKLQLIATGMHMSPEFGLTYKIIEKDGFEIDRKIENLLSSDSAVGITKAIGIAQIAFADAFEELNSDIILLLGDRFEIFAAATAAMIAKMPIAHCHGGEATYGLIDEPIRHSITKMSHIHFASTEDYRRRIIQLGESPERVFNVGGLGIENINKLKLLSRNELEEAIDFKLKLKNLLITFHPVTLENDTSENQFEELLSALDDLSDTGLIFTKPNSDTDGRIIIKMIDDYVDAHQDKAISFVSMGQLRYLSTLSVVDGMVGNSSSGLIEAPSFKVPTINIGDRQGGRVKPTSVIDCVPEKEDIVSALKHLFSEEFRKQLKTVENPYGKQNSSERILEILRTFDLHDILKKRFYDISFRI